MKTQQVVLQGLTGEEARLAAKAIAIAFNADVECRVGYFKWQVAAGYAKGSKPARAQWVEMSTFGQGFLAGYKYATQIVGTPDVAPPVVAAVTK